VNLTTFYCELVAGELHLTEHADVLWLEPKELGSLAWAPADIPAVDIIQGACARNG
jgi:8-oxo-dGTP diphosphatase